MSATGSDDPTLDPDLSAEDHAYFLAIEKLFNRLADRAHLLAPGDWHLARQWRRAGIPLELLEKAMGEFFRQQKERDPKDRIHSLRRLAPAVAAQWRQVRELTAIADRSGDGVGESVGESEPFDLPVRLEDLAAQLPEELPDREAFAARIRALTGDAETVENALADLDAELFQAAEASLDPAQKAGIDAAVTVALRRLAGRLTRDEITRARDRLRRQVLRERSGLPWLSLF